MTTMLQLIQQATGEMGLAVPTFVTSNTNADTVQQLSLLNAVGYEVSRLHPWQALNKAYIFTVATATVTGTSTIGSSTLTAVSSVSGIDSTYQIVGDGLNQACYVTGTTSGPNTITLSQPATGSYVGATYTLTKSKYSLPSDYDRQIDNTQWDKTKHWQMLGPETPQQWEWLISGYISTGPRVRYRIFGGYFQIWPALAVNETLGFEYVSKAWANDTTGTAKNSLTVDTDTCMFPDRLMVLGLKKKYFEIKGFDASAFAKDYETELSISKSNDAGSATLSFAPNASQVLIGWENLPDSGYGS